MVAPMEMDLMLAEANKMDVDVLCWGGTHRFDAFEYENKFFVNPGSATGAFTTGWVGDGEEMVPSFCLMDVSLGYVERRCRQSANMLCRSRDWD
jgi:vacuolar protein sorting-associated protein 29